jgi:hypothetical protein
MISHLYFIGPPDEPVADEAFRSKPAMSFAFRHAGKTMRKNRAAKCAAGRRNQQRSRHNVSRHPEKERGAE